MDIDNITVGQKIKKIRINQGLNQDEFGVLIDNAHKSLVSKWEKGMSLPNKSRLRLIADIAKITVDELVFEDLDIFYRDNFNQVLSYFKNINVSDVNQLFDKWLNQYKDVFTYNDEIEIQISQHKFVESYLKNLNNFTTISSYRLIQTIKKKVIAARNELPKQCDKQDSSEANEFEKIENILKKAIAEIEEVESKLE
jgi:transcriptional regulator with XRE-family HTH domain